MSKSVRGFSLAKGGFASRGSGSTGSNGMQNDNFRSSNAMQNGDEDEVDHGGTKMKSKGSKAWGNLHCVVLEEGLSDLGNMVGRFLKVDCTTSVIARGNFERLCIKYDRLRTLMHILSCEEVESSLMEINDLKAPGVDNFSATNHLGQWSDGYCYDEPSYSGGYPKEPRPSRLTVDILAHFSL
ncbi:hypothetical protein Ancab_001980 [Ancistrocladus abbreviatus]